MRVRRPSPQTIRLLRAFANAPQEWRYGYELASEVGLRSGSLYSILVRLCDRALLESQWEVDPPPGRPPRHLYRLTGSGHAYAVVHAGADMPDARAGRRRRLE